MLQAQLKGASAIKGGPSPEGGNSQIKTTNFIPDPVETLGEFGKEKWKQIATILIGRGTWSLDWVVALEHICREYDNLFALDQALEEPGQSLMVSTLKGQSFKMNPLLEYRLKTEALIQAMLGQFGLTPISAKGIYTQDDSQRSKQRAEVRARGDDSPFDE